MTYTVMDQQGRHSSEKIDLDMVQAACLRNFDLLRAMKMPEE